MMTAIESAMQSGEITMDEWQAEMDRLMRAEAERNPSKYKKWTRAELAILRKYHGLIARRCIAELLGRSMSSVENTIYRYNIARNDK